MTSGKDAVSTKIRENDVPVGDTAECRDTPVTGVDKNDAFVRGKAGESLDDDPRSHDLQQDSVLRVNDSNVPEDRFTEASELTNRDDSQQEDLCWDDHEQNVHEARSVVDGIVREPQEPAKREIIYVDLVSPSSPDVSHRPRSPGW